MRTSRGMDGPSKARVLLAVIRLVNGGVALLAPQVLARRLGATPETNTAVLYALRMFGSRTVVIGADLLSQTGERRTEALDRGVLIHASDTIAALLAARGRRLPGRMGLFITLISLTNTLLAVSARFGKERRQS